MINIVEKLRDCQKGEKLYSTIFGECEFFRITPGDSIIVIYDNVEYEFNKYGCFGFNNKDGECVLFPSKDYRDWEGYNKTCNFKPFDKVIGRLNGLWDIDFFSRFVKNSEYAYFCLNGVYTECLPYNEETAKLIGTTNDYVQ
jgi:hypothetical protein